LCEDFGIVSGGNSQSSIRISDDSDKPTSGAGILVFLHPSPACRSFPDDDLWRGPEPQIPQAKISLSSFLESRLGNQEMMMAVYLRW